MPRGRGGGRGATAGAGGLRGEGAALPAPMVGSGRAAGGTAAGVWRTPPGAGAELGAARSNAGRAPGPPARSLWGGVRSPAGRAGRRRAMEKRSCDVGGCYLPRAELLRTGEVPRFSPRVPSERG